MSFGVSQFAVLVINATGFHTWTSCKQIPCVFVFFSPVLVFLFLIPVYLDFNICAFGKDQMLRQNLLLRVHLKICAHSGWDN